MRNYFFESIISYICTKQGKVEKKSSTEAKMYKYLLGSFKLNHTF